MQFIVQLHGTRAGWPENMTPAEEETMQKHYEYLRALTWTGKVILAGPCLDPVYGLVVLDVADEAEARRIMDAEPSVTGGVHTYTLHPFVASLIRRHDPIPAQENDRVIRKEVVVSASRDSVWDAWTTEEGIKSFFAPDCRVELRVGGPYEMLFLPEDQPPGARGGEGNRILSFLPKELLTFSWNAPPQFAAVRPYRTRVVLQFTDTPAGGTRVTLSHLGWGDGEEWNAVYDYFDAAWARVLTNLQKRFE